MHPQVMLKEYERAYEYFLSSKTPFSDSLVVNRENARLMCRQMETKGFLVRANI